MLQFNSIAASIAANAKKPNGFNPNTSTIAAVAKLVAGFYTPSGLVGPQKKETEAGADANASKQHVTEKSQQFEARLVFVDRNLVIYVSEDGTAQWCLLGKSREFLLIALDQVGAKQEKIPDIQAILLKKNHLPGFSAATNRFVASVIAACASALESHSAAKTAIVAAYQILIPPRAGSFPGTANVQDPGPGYIADETWRDDPTVKWIFFALSHLCVSLEACNLSYDSPSVEEREKFLTDEFHWQYNLAFAFHLHLFKGFKFADDLATAAAINFLKKLDAKSPDAQQTLLTEYARHLFKLHLYPTLSFVRKADPDNLFSVIPQEFVHIAKKVFASSSTSVASEPAASVSKNTPPKNQKNKSAKAKNTPSTVVHLPPVAQPPLVSGTVRQRSATNASVAPRPANPTTEDALRGFVTEANLVTYNNLLRNLPKHHREQVWNFVKEKRLLPTYQNGTLYAERIQAFIDGLK